MKTATCIIAAAMLLTGCATGETSGGGSAYVSAGCYRLAEQYAVLSRQLEAQTDRINGAGYYQSRRPSEAEDARLATLRTDTQSRMTTIENQSAARNCPLLPSM